VKQDLAVSIVCLVAAVFLYYSLGWIDGEQARIFPGVVLIITGCLSIALLIQSLMTKGVQASGGKPFPWKRFLSLFVLTIVYFYFMEIIGFYTSAFLFFVTVTIGFGRSEMTMVKAGSRIGIAVVFCGVLYVLFKILLKVQTPSGVLF
jgi:hypothetical protein